MDMNVATISPTAKHPNVMTSILWALLLTQSPAHADYASFEEMAIEKVQATLTSKIETGRPAVPFEKWFQNLAGKDVDLKWELNDCGEQLKGSCSNKFFKLFCSAIPSI